MIGRQPPGADQRSEGDGRGASLSLSLSLSLWCRPHPVAGRLSVTPNCAQRYQGPAHGRGDSRTLGCDQVQQHVELQPLICSALLNSPDPVVGGLCIHILGLSLE
jgi:hypothetical protein